MRLVLSLISLVCFYSFSPGIMKRAFFNNHVVGGCIQSINNWPEVWSVLTWIPVRRGLLSWTELLSRLARKEDLNFFFKSQLINIPI